KVWNDKIYILLPDPKDPTVALPKPDYEAFLHAAPGSPKKAHPKVKQADKNVKKADPNAPNGGEPFIQCALEVKTLGTESGNHAVFHVAKLAPGQPLFGSFTHGGRTRAGVERNLLTDQDVQVRPREGEQDLYYHTVSHEVGHLLGLKHIN